VTILETKTNMKGNATIEFALVAPLFLLLLVGVIDLGYAFYEQMVVEDAVEAGAAYASLHGWQSGGITSAVTNATGVSGISASPAPSLFCGCPADNGIAPISCASTCSGGITPGQYVQISAQTTHTPILTYPALIIPSTFTSQATVRIQ
jgi:hypothetical protein